MKRVTRIVWLAVLMMVVGLGMGLAQPPAQTPGGRRGGPRRSPGPPSVSVRAPDAMRTRTYVTNVLGWRVGVPASAFGQLTFSEAAGKADAVGVASIEGFNKQRVSAEIQKDLDYNLSPEEVAKVKYRLAELRLQMPVYHVDSIPADESSRRRLFQFAKDMGVTMIVSGFEPAALADLDKLANEFGVNVALEGLSPKSVAGALQGRSQRIGVSVDIGKWMESGIKPQEGLPLVYERLMAVNLRDRNVLGVQGRNVTLGSGAAAVPQFLLEMSRRQPFSPPEWPPKCADNRCTSPTVAGKPLFLSVETTGAADASADLLRSAEALEKDIRPAMGYRANQIARATPITTANRVTPEERQKIEAALPRQAIVKPLKARKLLVVDVCPNAFVHNTIAHGYLALELMAKNTGAYQPVFSNDPDNLKYPKIKEFDAVFLNGIGGGDVFVDPDVLNGLMRFVREGGGLAGLHGSTYASQDTPEFGEMLGAQDGPHRVEPATLKIDDPASPLTKMFGGKGFEWTDEFYHFVPTGPYTREKLHVLVSIDAAKSDMSQWKVRPDNDYGMSWIRSYGKGRVFNCALGHTPELFANPLIAQHILAGIQFVLGDLKADATPSAKLAGKR